MAQFNYEKYQQQQASRKQYSQNSGEQPSGERTPIHFINEWLKNDGDSVVVRFPYHSMNDVIFETTHSVTFPGEKYPKRVRCDGDDCILCKQKVKLDTRFFLKAVAYTVNDEGNVELNAAIWDRPAAFADIDLKNLMDEYDDLTEHLFKIKRNGLGLDTTYSITIILNKTVYNPAVYKKDFSILENVDPVRILTKSIEQYTTALNGGQPAKESVEAPRTAKVEAVEEPVVHQQKEEPVEEEAPVEQKQEQRKVNRYSF